MRLPAVLAATVVALPNFALAAGPLAEPTQVRCYYIVEGRPFLDVGISQQFHLDAARRDDAVMAQMTGIWHSEFQNDQGIKAYVDYSFEPNGLFQYQSQTCGPLQCSPMSGVGQWLGLKMDGGQIRVIFNWTDLNIESSCGGATGTINGNVFETGGGVWQLRHKYEANGLPVDPGMAPPQIDFGAITPSPVDPGVLDGPPPLPGANRLTPPPLPRQ